MEWVAYKDGKKIANSITYRGVMSVVNAHRWGAPTATYFITVEGR